MSSGSCSSSEYLGKVEVVGDEKVADSRQKINVDSEFGDDAAAFFGARLASIHTSGEQLFVLGLLLALLMASNEIEDGWQDEDSGALRQPSNDAKDQSEVINEDCRHRHDQQVREAHSQVHFVGKHVFGSHFTLDRLADEARAECGIGGGSSHEASLYERRLCVFIVDTSSHKSFIISLTACSLWQRLGLLQVANLVNHCHQSDFASEKHEWDVAEEDQEE